MLRPSDQIRRAIRMIEIKKFSREDVEKTWAYDSIPELLVAYDTRVIKHNVLSKLIYPTLLDKLGTAYSNLKFRGIDILFTTVTQGEKIQKILSKTSVVCPYVLKQIGDVYELDFTLKLTEDYLVFICEKIPALLLSVVSKSITDEKIKFFFSQTFPSCQNVSIKQ